MFCGYASNLEKRKCSKQTIKFKLKTVRKTVTQIRKRGPHTTFTLFLSSRVEETDWIHTLRKYEKELYLSEALTLLPHTNCSTSSGLKSRWSGDSSVTIWKPRLKALNCFSTDLFKRKSAYKSTNSCNKKDNNKQLLYTHKHTQNIIPLIWHSWQFNSWGKYSHD
jgi:hypothetical protein